MSLLNQMLRDLEQRKTGNDTSLRSNPVNIHVAEQQTGGNSFVSWGIIVLLGILGALVFGLFYSPSKSSRENPLATVSITGQPPSASQTVETNPLAAINVKAFEPETTAPDTPEKIIPLRKTSSSPEKPEKVPIAKQTKAEKPANKTVARKSRPKPIKKARPPTLYKQALEQTSAYAKQHLLEKAIIRDPGHFAARVALTKVLLSQGKTTQAAIFLDQNLQQFPTNLHFIKARAQLYLQEKNLPAALSTLQRASPIPQRDVAYLSLLASIYQQKQEFKQSAELYRRLVIMAPDQAEYWLGLAISEENLGGRSQALQAYRQALSNNTLKSSVVSYIKQRVTTISQ